MLKDNVCRIPIKRKTAFTSTFLRAYVIEPGVIMPANGHDTLGKTCKAAITRTILVTFITNIFSNIIKIVI